jgi:hypothetical protein
MELNTLNPLRLQARAQARCPRHRVEDGKTGSPSQGPEGALRRLSGGIRGRADAAAAQAAQRGARDGRDTAEVLLSDLGGQGQKIDLAVLKEAGVVPDRPKSQGDLSGKLRAK